MSYRLRGDGEECVLVGDLLIGRATDCQLRLHGGLVSRHHARLSMTPKGVLLEDLGSRNGVVVNGEKVQGRRLLRHGDIIGIGMASLELLDERIVRHAPHLSTLPPASPPYMHPDVDDDQETVTLSVLSRREQEVLELLVLGHTQREVAARLCISPKTVETHRRRICEKVGCHTRAELVSYAISAGVLGARRSTPTT